MSVTNTSSSIFDYYSKELNKVGVNRVVLWEEYSFNNPHPYSYAQFCHHLLKYRRSSKPSMVMEHKAGDKLSYIDKETGEEIFVQVFVACLALITALQ